MAWSAGRLAAADPSGTYEFKTTSPLMEFSSKGEKRLIKEIEVIQRLEFRSDHELRAWRYSDGAAKPETISLSGAWLTRGDQVFYLLGYSIDSDNVSWLCGMSVFRNSADALEIENRAGWPMFLSDVKVPRFVRVGGAAADFPGKAPSFTQALQALQAIVGGITRDGFVGSPSKDAMIAEARRAFAAKDLPAPMRLSYPTSGPYNPEERLHTYLRYQQELAGRGIDKFEEAGRESSDFLMQEKFSKQADIWFPPPIEAEGCFKLTKTWTKGSSTGYLFYGRVGDRWGIIGDPLRLKELPQQPAKK
jgi:hypothetical protein